MGRTLALSNDLYARLQATAREHGLEGVEQLLERWQADEENRRQRLQAVQEVDALRARLLATYGEMPDSTSQVREDRDR